MKYRNISGGDLACGWPGAIQATAAADEVVDIPAFQPDGESPIVVPPDKWEPVAEKKQRASKADG